jgi:hypothetical protein
LAHAVLLNKVPPTLMLPVSELAGKASKLSRLPSTSRCKKMDNRSHNPDHAAIEKTMINLQEVMPDDTMWQDISGYSCSLNCLRGLMLVKG